MPRQQGPPLGGRPATTEATDRYNGQLGEEGNKEEAGENEDICAGCVGVSWLIRPRLRSSPEERKDQDSRRPCGARKGRPFGRRSQDVVQAEGNEGHLCNLEKDRTERIRPGTTSPRSRVPP